jgi:hypothetical protein
MFATKQRPSGGTAVIPIGSAGRQERLRFANFAFTRTPSGQCSAEVSLEWENATFVGRAIGQSSPLGDYRVAADAALRAVEDFTKLALRFDLLGVKHIRAFDANLLIVCVSLRQDDGAREARLVGCYLADGDTRRGAAMAVLNATNRVLGNHISTR